MKEAICLLPVIWGCESVCDTRHFEPVHHPPTSSPHSQDETTLRSTAPPSLAFFFFFSATSKLRFPSIVAPLFSYRPYYLHLKNAAVSCHCSLFVLWHCHVKCFSFRTQRNTWRGFLSASKDRRALNKLQLQVSLAFICQSILHWKHCLHYQLWNLWEHENFLAQESKLLQNGLSMWSTMGVESIFVHTLPSQADQRHSKKLIHLLSVKKAPASLSW